MGYHLLNLRGFLVAGLEILMYSVVQIYGFSYIYNMIPRIVHEIYSWDMGELLKFFFKIKHVIHLKNLR